MMKTARSRSVAVSFGSRFLKRMTPSGAGARPGDDREPQDEQRVREQRADDRRLRHDELAGGEGEEDDEELGQVAERRLERSGHGRPEAHTDGLRRDGDHPGQAGQRDGGDQEGRDWVGVQVVERPGGDRGESDAAEDGVTDGQTPCARTSLRASGPTPRAPCSAPTREQAHELGLVGAQLLVALLDRRDQRDDRIRHVRLELAVALAVVPCLDRLRLVPGGDGQDVDQVLDPRLVRAAPHFPPGVRDGAAHFLRSTSGGSSSRTVPCIGPARRGHLPLRLLEIHDPRADLRVDALAAP